jgi:hypothetical protein
VLQSIADALDISAETLLARTGIFHPTHGAPDTATATQVTDTETAIWNDPHLTPDDRDPLIRIYRSLRKPPSD